MISKTKLAPLYLSLFLALAACSGDPVPVTEENTDTVGDTDTEDLVNEGSLTNISYLPLLTLEVSKDWSGFTEDRIFRTYNKSLSADNSDPSFIQHYLIKPVNATTLAPISTAKLEDYTILEDGVPLNPKVNYPMLQKVLGNSVQLSTAIVINTSSAMDGINRPALINEIKNYIATAKADSDRRISQQRFTIWGFDGASEIFDGGIIEETGGFSTDESAISAALDRVSAKWLSGEYSISGSNHAYDAVIESIGRYFGDGPFTTGEVLRDSLTSADDDNDLVDYMNPDAIQLSSIIFFSSGFSSSNRFDAEYFIDAMESQALLIYDEDAGPAGDGTTTKELGKSLIYVVPDSGDLDTVVSGMADSIITPNLSGSSYTFAQNVIAAQKAAVDKRISPNDQYVLRFASMIRFGEGHETILKTRTDSNKYGYALTATYDVLPLDYKRPTPHVEITGANNEYLAMGKIYETIGGVESRVRTYDSAIAYADQITTFYPAVRWSNQAFSTSDYTWSSVPSNAFTENTDGSVTIKTDVGYPIVLTLSNNAISYEGATLTDDFVLTINEKY